MKGKGQSIEEEGEYGVVIPFIASERGIGHGDERESDMERSMSDSLC